MCDEFAWSPDQRREIPRLKVPDIEGCQKVGLISYRSGENRNVFGVRLTD
jgi:hypothetical protein